jgi:hypothetical protein
MKRCIITFASTDRYYHLGLRRLEAGLRRFKFQGDFIAWQGTYPPGCPVHLESPWAFKPFVMDEAALLGYDQIAWCDASIIFVASPDALFDCVSRRGYFLFRDALHQARGNPLPSPLGVSVGQWSSDVALEEAGISREEAFHIPELWAACIGLDMRRPASREFLARWKAFAADAVAFRGYRQPPTAERYRRVYFNEGGTCAPGHPAPYPGYPGPPPAGYAHDPNRVVGGHRHDQTMASILAYRLGMNQLLTHEADGCRFLRCERRLPKRGSEHRYLPSLGKLLVKANRLIGRRPRCERRVVACR